AARARAAAPGEREAQLRSLDRRPRGPDGSAELRKAEPPDTPLVRRGYRAARRSLRLSVTGRGRPRTPRKRLRRCPRRKPHGRCGGPSREPARNDRGVRALQRGPGDQRSLRSLPSLPGPGHIFTIRERKGPDLRGVAIAYVGDGNNVAHSLMLCAAKTGASLRVATPAGYEPLPRYRELAAAEARSSGAEVLIGNDPISAVSDADVVYTDVWTSMGQEQEYERRRRSFQGFQLNAALLARAKRDAVVLHDLPAHRGEEITDEVIDGPQSAVFDQAENRLHTEKALLCSLLGGK